MATLLISSPSYAARVGAHSKPLHAGKGFIQTHQLRESYLKALFSDSLRLLGAHYAHYLPPAIMAMDFDSQNLAIP